MTEKEAALPTKNGDMPTLNGMEVSIHDSLGQIRAKVATWKLRGINRVRSIENPSSCILLTYIVVYSNARDSTVNPVDRSHYPELRELALR